MADLCGVVLIDKPVGPTSFDVVRAVKRALKVKSAGHTGTLDPNASGLLPICLGDATRIASFLTDGSKVYDGTVLFGVQTDTLDAEGTVTGTRACDHLTREGVEAAIATLVGTQDQIVPMFSAHKVGGRRLYDLAREGQEVERPTQRITVESATLLDWSPPRAVIRFRCSKGTYIRSLAALLGERLEVGAHLAALRRSETGGMSVDQALPLAAFVELAAASRASAEARMHSVEQALAALPECRLDTRRAMAVGFGNAPGPADRPASGWPEMSIGTVVRLTNPEGLIVAVGQTLPNGGIELLRVLRANVGPGKAKPTPP
jgi:tRNA pseudouridine55 synthase